MDPTKHKWTPCTECNFLGLFQQNHQDKTEDEWICMNYGSTVKPNNEPSANLTETPLHNEEHIQLRPPDQEITTQDTSEMPTYNQNLPKPKKIHHVNMNGLSNKYKELRYFLSNETSVTTCAITESKLKSRNHENMYQIPGYNMVRIDRSESKNRKVGGGTIIYVYEMYDFQIYEYKLAKPDIMECCILKIIGNFQNPILLAVVYLPPDISHDK